MKVLKNFFDITTKTKYFPGDEYEGPRADEFAASGLIEAQKAKPGPKANKADKTTKKNK